MATVSDRSTLRLWLECAGALGGLSLLPQAFAAGVTLPVPCVAGSCGSGVSAWVSSGAANAVQQGNTLTVNQLSSNATLNWQTFNISSNGKVTFNQPSATAVALNQIFQADPSKILGALSANGSVYLINQNGIVFGNGAQVNVASLIASSLNITSAAANGILLAAQQSSPAFANFVDANGNVLPSGPVSVQAGANLQAGTNGQIILIAPQVQNAGNISANGGQVILAAGNQVYLAASSDPNLRGLVVQVGSGGTATNSASGQIAANLGDVTMVGLIVNQMGRVSATTSVEENGSVYLLAQDGGAVANVSTSGVTLSASNGGTLNLGSSSHTDVTLDTASTATAVDATAQPRSQVILNGQQVTLASGSEITATAGQVTVTAAANPTEAPAQFVPQAGTGRLVIEPDATINVAGANVQESVASNIIPVQLRGTELADSPLQRNGPLEGQTVYIDVRKSGTLPDGASWIGSPIGDLSGYVSDIQRTVGERSLTGGTIALNSDGAVLVYPGANLNISGGSIQFLGGYVNTTQVLATNGVVYDISQAQPDLQYVGIVNTNTVTDPKWGTTQTYNSANNGQYESGYVEGKDAGTVAIAAPAVVLDGNISANTVVGPFQRALPGAIPAGSLYRPVTQLPLGGTLDLGLTVASANGGYLIPEVTFASAEVLPSLTGPAGAPYNPLTDPLPAALSTVSLRPSLFGADGVAQLDIFANGRVSIPQNIALDFPVAGGIAIVAGAVDIEGTIRAPSGSVTAAAEPTLTMPPGSADANLTLGAAATLDVSGYFVNDLPPGTNVPGAAPLAISGGTVALAASGGASLLLEPGSLINVSGGAQLTSSGTLNPGAGGSIALAVAADQNLNPVTTMMDSTLRGFALAQGGQLSLTANSICIAASNCSGGAQGALWVAPSLFTADGFAKVSLTSDVGGLQLLSGTSLAPTQLNYQFNGSPLLDASGASLAQLATPTLLPQASRNPVDVSLTANAIALTPDGFATQALDIGANSQIALDPAGVLSLSAATAVVVDGQLSAPGGSISVSTNTNLALSSFLPNQGIWLEPGAQLSTQGVALTQVNDQGLVTGSVLSGGTISLIANRGYLITAPGSTLNAAGTEATLDLAPTVAFGQTPPVPTSVASAGGTVNLTASEGMFLNGAVLARAGAPGVAGGTLNVTLDGSLHDDPSLGAPILPVNPHELLVEAQPAPVIVLPGYAVPNSLNGIGELPAQVINGGGFTNVTLAVPNEYGPPLADTGVVSYGSIVFPQSTTLTVAGSLRLDTPTLVGGNNAQISLSAPYVGLGYDDTRVGSQVNAAPLAGNATLTVQGQLVELIGTLGLSGFQQATLDSTGDLRLRGVQTAGEPTQPIAETLQTQGTLVLQAQQIYATTLTQADVTVLGSDSILDIRGVSGTAAPVLSAGAELTLNANTIDQGGVLRVPFGQIVLNANQLTLEPGSLTSTSGAGEVVPFGTTQAGADFVYTLPQGQTVVYTDSGPPAKSVVLQANSINVAHGATVDVSGGGDLQAYEFIPGTGGTNDILANSYNPQAFAILPLSGLKFSPYDPDNALGFSYPIGESVTLGAGSGVPAGTYAILPARYALLPGAYLVTPASGYSNIAFGQAFTQLNGSTVVAGRFTQAGSSLGSSLTQGFDIESQALINTQAQYTLTSANGFFSTLAAGNKTLPPPLPIDAGVVEFLAGEQLEFEGLLEDTAPKGGRSGQVDISATQLEIATSAAPATPGVVVLDEAQLNLLSAASLLIGGTRTVSSTTPGAIDIQTTAASISVAPNVALSGSELILTATNDISVGAGAQLSASGGLASVPTQYDLVGDGALLRVSTGAQAPIERTGVQGLTGNLTLAAGAVLRSAGSVSLDATGSLSSQSSYDVRGGSLAFSAPQISLGSGSSASGNLVLSPTVLSSLDLANLSLTSGSSIDLYGSNALTIEGTLSLNAALLEAASGDASATLQAQTIALTGTGAAVMPAAVAASGGLNLHASQVVLGGNVDLAGFAAYSIDGEANIQVQGQGLLAADAPLTLRTALLSGTNSSNFAFTTPAALAVLGPTAASSPPSGAAGAGVTLALSGSNVLVDTAVRSPSGTLSLTGTGAGAAGDVTLGSSAAVGLAGDSVTFDTVTQSGPGGRLLVSSDSGNFVEASGATVDLSAGGTGAAAGTLSITVPQGTATLQGALSAQGQSGGGFSLEAAQLPDLGALNTILNTGGFAGARTFWQTGSGDVILPSVAGGAVHASSVTIEADGGSVDVQGAIDASGTVGGSVSLFAANGVSVEGTISAAASGAGAAGGSLQIAAGNGSVQIANSATIDLGGGAGAAGGTLSLQLPQSSLTAMLTPGNAAVTLAGTYRGVQQVQVEGLQTYVQQGGTISAEEESADPSNPIYATAAAFMQNASAIAQAVAGQSGLNVSVVPGIEIESSVDLTLATAWDLSTWRFNGVAGILTLRSAGNLIFDQSLSDGFDGVGSFTLPTTPGPSWSYRLVAGADLNASNLMAVVPLAALPSGEGNVVLAAGIPDGGSVNNPPVPNMIRTGTGSISIAAAGDLQFGNQASVIYTAGEASSGGIPLDGLQDLAYPTGGGNISISVGGDILGAPTNQLVTAWLWRTGQIAGSTTPSATGWTVSYPFFEENLGALGGGNVSISAAGDVSELSVAIPNIGVQVGGTTPAANLVQVTGGGTLSVQSGGNITGGSYFVGSGTGTLFAQGMIGIDTSGRPTATGDAPILALGDAQMSVGAIGDVAIESALNPMLLPQALTQPGNAKVASLFSTYSADSAVDLLSVSGDVNFINDVERSAGPTTLLSSMNFVGAADVAPFNVFPATVNATALTGNVLVNGGQAITLWPSPTGNLNLFAEQNVEFSPNGAALLMSDIDPSTLPDAANPVRTLLSNVAWQGIFQIPQPGFAHNPIHSAGFSAEGSEDPTPVRIVANSGDISDADLIYIPKPIHIVAGGDITNLNLQDEQLSAADLSVISAGGNIVFQPIRDPVIGSLLADNGHGIVIEGPGSLLMTAGGNINLGTSAGITTAGDLFNPALPAEGANVSVMAGATVARADLSAFTSQYLESETTYDAALIAFVEQQTNEAVGSKSQALEIFKSLSANQQFELCEQVLYDELTVSGVAAASPGSLHGNYSRGFDALAKLFPGSTSSNPTSGAAATYPGSITMYFSRIYTLDGGDISLLAPGGFVNVGISTPPTAFGITKGADQLGVVAQGSGDVSSVSYGDFEVNQSRVFAADGGNILVWSTDGNIDAGRGAKTAISAPAPTITFDSSGHIQTVFPPALTGSGIQALSTTPGLSPGDVDLFAPQGVVNANDAGIVAGNLVIGATAVLGRNNITFSGVAVGLPVENTGLGAALAGTNSVASSAANAATMGLDTTNKADSAPSATSALSWLDVFLVGLGEENCKPDDMECLKRAQQRN